MVRGLRVVFSPSPEGRAVSPPSVPQAGAHGTITAVKTPEGLRTYRHHPRSGLVYVEWDRGGIVGSVSLRDLTLEPADEQPHA